MAVWNEQNVKLTQKGQTLLSKVQLGIGSVTITKVLVGEGRVAESELFNLAGVSVPKQEMQITQVTPQTDRSIIDLQLSNEGITATFSINQIGVYATHPDTGEVLYMIAQCDEGTADVMPLPEVTPVVVNYKFTLIHSGVAQVNVAVNLAGVVTAEQFSIHLNDKNNPHVVTVTQIGAETPSGAQAKVDAHANNKNNPHAVTAAQIGAANILTQIKTVDGANSGLDADTIDTKHFTDIQADAQSKVDAHAAITVQTGIHGLRYYNDILQFFNGTEWIEIETGGGGVPPSNVINPTISIGNGQLTIKWTDPNDTVIDGQLISTWAGTKLVRKAGSFPTDEKDGVVLVDNKVRGAYASTGFVDSGLTNGTTYYYQLFPYNDLGAVNKNTANRLSAAPQPFKIFGVRIDLTNSNPETSVTYTDDAIGMTAGSSAWDSMAIFKDIKPCVLKNGVVQYYLNPNNFAQKADGSAADITSGNDGDVMIEIPKTGFSITTNGNYIDVKVTDNPNNAAFKYYAHSRDAEGDRQKLYIGAYKGYKDASNKLRSLSGKAPTVSQTIGTFRTQAQANGSGYDMLSFYPLTLIQCLYLIKYKNLDSQTALGRGYVGGTAAQNTGATNSSGMCYGSTSTTSRVKLFGIEDFWGNIWEWIDGLYSDASRNILTAFQNFNDTGNGYTNRGQGATADIGGYMSKPQGTSESGFVIKEAAGSSTTYFADYANLYAGYLPIFGGNWDDGANAGAFHLFVHGSASSSDASIGTRLMYL